MRSEQSSRAGGSSRPRSAEGRAPASLVSHRVPREICADFAASSKLEWLETNGTGGFAMGTVAGVNTRRYHGLLVASLNPPVDRFVLLSKLEETVRLDGREHDLGVTQYPGVVSPEGYKVLDSFRFEPFPIWTYAVDGAVVEKRLFLVAGKQTVVVQYRVSRECRLRVRPFLAYRDFHGLASENAAIDGRLTHERSSPESAVVRITPYAGLPSLAIHHGGTASAEGACWYRSSEYLVELDRGLPFREDLYCMGNLEFAVAPDRPAWLVATLDGNGAWDLVRVLSEEAVECERRRSTESSPFVARLSQAAEAFRVRRADGSPTIIAGYPWFADWGRDTMISLPGLLIARGLLDEAQRVLSGFLEHLDGGVIPNRFVDGGAPPEYNTADGTLWMFYAVQELLRAGGSRRWVRDVFYPRAQEIVAAHKNGTHHGIHVDPADGLVVAGSPGTQLTWMDAKIGDWVVTPRSGKAVEINALWYNALRFLEELATEMGHTAYASEVSREADRVQAAFAGPLWNATTGGLFDVLFPDGPDERIRPNQIFAVSLPYSPLTADQKKSVVRLVERELLTPVGLRTLSPGHPEYRPRYEGDPVSRDSAYHQGTVWPWLLGPYVTAYLNAFGRTSATKGHVAALLAPLEAHLDTACLGQVSEVTDADPPYAPGGAPAQAWSVAELLRVLKTELAEP